MPNTREKLIELLNNSFEEQYSKRGLLTAPHTADDLIATGVTVQQWIPVTERLPTAEDALLDSSVYAYTKAKMVLVLHYQYVCRHSDYILCWMPISIPQPPKGE